MQKIKKSDLREVITSLEEFKKSSSNELFRFLMDSQIKDLKKSLKNIAVKKFLFKPVITTDIVEVISGVKFADERMKLAKKWCKLNHVDIKDFSELRDEVNKGKERQIKKSYKDEQWKIPSLEMCKKLNKLNLFDNFKSIWTSDFREDQLLNGQIVKYAGQVIFGTSSLTIDVLRRSKKFFGYLIKQTETSYITRSIGYLTYDELENACDKNNEVKTLASKKKSSLKSSPKKSQTKYKTPFMYVIFHYAFGSKDYAPTDSKAFKIRAVQGKSKQNPLGIKIKDFEINDTGMINARFYIDSEIRKNGIDLPLVFKQGDYEFISKYGPKNWIRLTGWKSNFDYEAAKRSVIDKYWDVPKKFTIVESYSKKLIVDNSPQYLPQDIPAHLLSRLSVYN